MDVGKVECAAPTGDRCGEGAVWLAAERAVYWTDINRFLIHRYDEETGAVRTWLFDVPVVALALTTEEGRLLVALGDRLILWRPRNDERLDHGFTLPGWPRVRLNDGRADPHGTFWVGSMKNNVNPDGSLGETAKGEGILFRVSADGRAVERRRGVSISNTLCWSPNGRTFYFGDTLENLIWAYDVDPGTGDISGERVHFSGFDRGFPDGSSIDAEGHLWNCRYGGSCIVRVAPDGKVSGVIDIPASNVTTCTFGGADLKTLYVTTAGSGAPAGERLAGSLFRLRSSVPGLAENRFKIA